jgi:hypothetical protein
VENVKLLKCQRKQLTVCLLWISMVFYLSYFFWKEPRSHLESRVFLQSMTGCPHPQSSQNAFMWCHLSFPTTGYHLHWRKWSPIASWVHRVTFQCLVHSLLAVWPCTDYFSSLSLQEERKRVHQRRESHGYQSNWGETQRTGSVERQKGWKCCSRGMVNSTWSYRWGTEALL